ncbi:hypothetical protein BJ508DRAFT_311454 [Ascobolus immersus RN42]|uniref:Transmembrane protein n=1 Tax=Ascobolus immersus RN42 TaxID=1160509 RepID=A0A3N4HVN7_ASCIM|nr:hypothetical protein BJ508DRAFT_311454 [Ascobolus immersus RN42]
MRSSALFTVFITVFLGFLQLAFAEAPVEVYETVTSTSSKIAVVTSTGVPPLAEATAVEPPRVIKVFTVSPEGQVLAALGPTKNATETETETETDAPAITETPSSNGTNSSSSAPNAPTQEVDGDDKDSAAVSQLASMPLLVGVIAAVFGVITL